MTGPHLVRMGRWIAALDPGAIPPDTLRAARCQVLNLVAALHGAARSAETASVARGVAGFCGDGGRATSLADGAKRAPADALVANACYSMAQDFDDIVWMGHTGHSAVFAALAVAEHEDASADAFLAAVVAANEIGGRFGASSLLGPLNGQMWTFIHPVGAAAATARLLGLSPTQTTHALAIALAQPPFALQPGFMLPTSKLLSAAQPAAAGVQAAYFARAGMTGATDIVEDRRGFWQRFSYRPLPSMMDGLGEFWTMQTLAVKTVPGCHYFQTACQAIDAIEREHGRIDPARVRRISLGTTRLAMEATRFAGEYARSTGIVTPVNANFDLAVTVAIRLLAGRLGSDQLHPQWLEDNSAAIRDLASRTSAVHDPSLTLATINSLRATGAGRGALASLRLADLPRLRRRYAEEYRSTLFPAAEGVAWIRALAADWRDRRGAAAAPPSPSAISPSAIPLPFGNRVTIEFADGRVLTAREDLPAGSFCSPGMESALREKFLRECTPALGADVAARAFAAGLDLGRTGLPDFVRLVARPAA